MKILRRIFNTDFNGNVISSKLEELNDNENGDVEELHLTSVSRCEACGRPLEKMNEIRGSCIICGRSCCSICEGFCSVSSWTDLWSLQNRISGERLECLFELPSDFGTTAGIPG